MKTNVFVALAALVLVFTACSKNNEGTNNDGGGTTQDYQPTSAGSTWQYSSNSTGTYTETAVAGDSSIGGQTFFKIDNSANGRRYVNKNNGIYTSYGYVPQIDTTLTLLYLKDAPAGTSWTNTGSYSGIPVTLTYTIASRDGEKEVNGKTFKDVIALDFNLSVSTPLGNTTVGTGHQYYAKGVGAISSNLLIDVPSVGIHAEDSTYLVSYDIK